MPKSSIIRLHASNGSSALQQTGNDFSSHSFISTAPTGFQSTLNRLSKWVVVIFFTLVIIIRHDAEALWATMGSVLNSWLSTKLKRILNQERPFSNSRSDPGMPSSHSQSIFFIQIFAVISLTEYYGLNIVTIILSAFTLAFGSYLSWLRIYQQFHTISQVAVGAMIGTVFAVLWFWLWDAVMLNAFEDHLWVRILVFLTTVGMCLGFVGYIIRYWFMYDIEPFV
ncbi:lipid phosphate phosphatase epsilon 2, chloroplastic-like [Impatiens glandulifera]|uniref:lipid phosphate phosphatase epsilon 2, chloroplastic-like n=1 Tax=Impatiens glandulifera TaxID=253017 RepID=UPI001FB17DFB|nr:lipid phosphate phosphatase epsilon 2, chloroplastic-like [Impatiens glandulifera]